MNSKNLMCCFMSSTRARPENPTDSRFGALFMFDPEAVSGDDLIETIEGLHEAGKDRFLHVRPDHRPMSSRPGGTLSPSRRTLQGVASRGQMLWLFRLATEILGLISVADSQPRARHHIESNGMGRCWRGGRHRMTVTQGARAAREENGLGAPGVATRRETPPRGSPLRRVPAAHFDCAREETD